MKKWKPISPNWWKTTQSKSVKQTYKFDERLETFSRELARLEDVQNIIALLRDFVQQDFHPSSLHVFIYEPLKDAFQATQGIDGQITSDLNFSVKNELPLLLSERRSILNLADFDSSQSELKTDFARVSILNCELIIPLMGQNGLIGWLGLASNRSGAPFTISEEEYLTTICSHAAQAIEPCQIIVNLERRVQEMDVVMRIAQGINITLDIDDILELVYAQTDQIIPNDDFHITLTSPISPQTLYHAFYIEDNERIKSQENLPLTPNQSLEEVILRFRQPLLCEDYEKECRNQGRLPTSKGLFAWLGVPLNAGAETIGILSLGSRDITITYTDHHCLLLQAIANQVAGAIVKSRLMMESERRTRQLMTLNEIGRSLTSTLESKPLLNQIMQSATEILNCEAGSLFTLEAHSGDLIFEVTTGPVAVELNGQRLPQRVGIAGKAAERGEPVIANKAKSSRNWFHETDQKTGFTTRDVLAVPMKVKDRIIGVIEVINKKDGAPFNQDDQDLLTIFTSQAAIAIENARLYTQTDKALSSRVEEMSILQRIDRELNASLDFERVMKITLEWASRQSKADAGMVGLIERDERNEVYLRIISSQGYQDESSNILDEHVDGDGSMKPLFWVDISDLRNTIESATPNIAYRNPISDELERGSTSHLDPSKISSLDETLLPGARKQAFIPLQGQGNTIGVLILESEQATAFPEETVAFLSRLCEHAAIAIFNAQLYADLQAANLAKSEFISLVSHELKTPMTSIKGYTDLLVQGLVGPVNEAQANFLSTIRSNVNRMATLVSDLTDVSRIESGRVRLDFSPVLINDVIRDVVRSSQAQLNEKGQTLDIKTPEHLPAVWADRDRTIQILSNILSNAHKYTPEGGRITIQADCTHNQCESQSAAMVIHVSVQDTGYGISPEEQPKIFQKFFRSDDQKIRETPGTGLGLNITRHLVEMQAGHIWFESELGKGTTFHFTLPVNENG